MPKIILGPNLIDLRGKLGDSVFTRAGDIPVVQRRPTYHKQFTPEQKASRDRFVAASKIWNSLTCEEAEQWDAFIRSFRKYGYTTGMNAFVSLSTLLMRFNPDAPVPRIPPKRNFLGDVQSLTVTGGVGQVTCTVSCPNTEDTWVELQYQRLKNERRKPALWYSYFRFARFEPGALEISYPLEPGWYAFAFRCVHAQTGQATWLTPIGVVQVKA